MREALHLKDAPATRAQHSVERHGRQRFRVSESDLRLLSTWIRADKTPQRVVRRARIVLLAADGCSARETAQRLGVSTHTVALWRRRYYAGGTTALLHDAPGRGRKSTVVGAAAARVGALLATAPPLGRWTVRALASALGISRASVHRVLKGGDSTIAGGSERRRRRQPLPSQLDAPLTSAVM